MNVTIPGALADHLADRYIGDDETAATLDAARRGRGRTLIIEPTSTRALHVISRHAEHILSIRGAYTRAQVEAARLWIKRAGHAPAILAHRFDSTAEAYNATQCRDDIHDGDVLIIEREGVVGFLRSAWPAAVTVAHGELHRVKGDPRTLDDGRYADSAIRAERIAAEYEFALAEQADRADALLANVREMSAQADALLADMREIDAQLDSFAAEVAAWGVKVDGLTAPSVEDTEAQQAAALVTEAEVTDGTWRGEWIGEQQAADTLFTIEAGQGALFDDRATEDTAPAAAEERPAPIVVRASFRRDDLDRIRAKADADRAAHRAEFDARRAAEAAQHSPAPRAIEGVIVKHAGTAEGSTPANATHPNVTAARAALDGLAVARMTDHHDVTEPTEAEQDVRGYLIDPREGARIAVYWLEGGRIIRRDTPWHGPALDCLADRLGRRGWRVEKMLKSSQCVFAHRPAND